MNRSSERSVLTEDLLTIPVCVHVVHSSNDDIGQGSNIPDIRIFDAIDDLNQNFLTAEDIVDSGNSEAMNISFCLAGFDRIESDEFTDLYREVEDNPNNQAGSIKTSTSQMPSTDFLNIWVVSSICLDGDNGNDCIIGYSTLPPSHGNWYDGIVIVNSAFGTASNSGIFLAHEVGHYLNLSHAFGMTDNQPLDCMNNDCLEDNDKVCDTRPDGSQFTCGPTNYCHTDADDTSINNPFTSDEDDPVGNYMDYGNGLCENYFTIGQKVRMRSSLVNDDTGEEGPRFSLLENIGACCSDGILQASFFYVFNSTNTSLKMEMNSNASMGNILNYSWTVSFYPGFTWSGPNPTIEFPNTNIPSVVTVCLTVTGDGDNCQDTNCQFICIEGNDGCQLICNPNFNSLSDDENSIVDDLVPSWNCANGSPSYSSEGLSNMSDESGSTSLVVDRINNTVNHEAVYTNVGILSPNTNYLFSMYKKANPTSGGVLNDAKSRVILEQDVDGNGLPDDFDAGINTVCGSATQAPIPPLNTALIIYDEPGFIAEENFVRYVRCFMIDNTNSQYKILVLYPNDEDENGGGKAVIGVTDVELIPDNFTAGEDIPLECPETILLGDFDCSLSDVTYTWEDITDPSNPVVLVQGSNTPLLELMVSESKQFRLTRKFGSAGDYEVDDSNCDNHLVDEVNVEVHRPMPNPDFDLTINDCETKVQFIGLDPDAAHTWTFIDSGNLDCPCTLTGNNVTFEFSGLGTFEVIHTVENDCGTLVVSETIEIPCAPNPDFDYSSNNCDLEVQFLGEDQNAVHTWTFNDPVNPTTLTGINVSFEFSGFGVFEVVHTVENDFETLEVTEIIEITCVSNSNPDFTYTANCDNTVSFTSLGMGEHLWTVSPGGQTLTSANPNITFPGSGTYTVIHTLNGIASAPQDFTFVGTGMNSTTLASNVFPNGEIVNQVISVQGTLLIDNPGGFLIHNVDANMGMGSSIVLDDHRSLRVLSSEFRPCDVMWKGFETLTDVNFTMISSVVEGAEFAIKSNGNPVTGSTSDISNISVYRSDFYNNFIGLYVPRGGTGVSQNVNFTAISQNKFLHAGGVPPPYPGQSSPAWLPAPSTRAYAGIWVAELTSMGVGSLPGYYPARNVFDNLANGIYAERTNLDVLNAQFLNIQQVNEYHNAGFRTGNGIFTRNFVTGASGFTLTQAGFGDEEQPSFDKCRNAIYAIGTNVDISENRIVSPVYGITVEECRNCNIDIVSNDVEDVKRSGIRILQCDAPGTHLYVGNNDVIQATGGQQLFLKKGIYFAGNSILNTDATVNKNRVTVSGTGTGIFLKAARGVNVALNNVTLNGGSFTRTGIRLDASGDGTLQENIVNGLGTSGSTTGVRVFNSPNVDYCCNTVDELRTGIAFIGNCASPNNFQANQFMPNLNTGLSLSSLGSAVLDEQLQMGNIWHEDLNSIPVGASHNGNQNVIALSRFRVNTNTNSTPSGNPDYLPDNPIPSTDWFIDNTTPNPNCFIVPECGLCDFSCFVGGPCDGLEKKIATDDASIQNLNEVVKWIGKRELYRKLDNNPDLQDDCSDISDFFNSSSNNEVGDFHQVEKSRESLFELDAATSQDLDIRLADINDYLDQIRAQRTALASASGQDSLDIVNALKDLMAMLGSEVDAVENMTAIINGKILSDAVVVQNSNNEIEPSAIYAENEAKVNDITFAIITSGGLTSESPIVSSLLATAQQCPLTGGNAVFRARSLLALVDNELTFVDEEICKRSTRERVEEEGSNVLPQETKAMSLVPNPSNGLVEIRNSFTEDFDFIIYDLNGTELVRFESLKAGTDTMVDVQRLPKGIYLCKAITSKGEWLSSEKMVTF